MNRSKIRRRVVWSVAFLAVASFLNGAIPANAQTFATRCRLIKLFREARRPAPPTATVEAFVGQYQYDRYGRTIQFVPQGLPVPLFNGVDLTGWTNVKGDAPGDGWKVVDGAIFREKGSGDLYVDGKFENFILEFEFKISEKGNSGVKYRSWNADGFGLGCEYQVYDDINDEKNPPRYQTASLYDVVPPREGTAKLKMDEYNRAKIVVAGNHIEHYLNGELTVSITVGSREWKELVAKSKFKDTKEFGTTKIGRILLQDHGNQVWFKNIRVTKLTPQYVGCGLFF